MYCLRIVLYEIYLHYYYPTIITKKYINHHSRKSQAPFYPPRGNHYWLLKPCMFWTLYKCNYIVVCTLVWFFSLNIMFVKFIHIVACSSGLFIVVVLYPIMCIYNNLFVYSIHNRQLSCFQFGAIRKNTAVKILVNFLFWCTYVPMSVELLGHRICVCSTLVSPVKQFSKWLCQFTYLCTVYENSSCPIASSTYIVLCSF